jgi:hypothetical protein
VAIRIWRPREDRRDEFGDRVEDLLAVVLHEERPRVGEAGEQALERRATRVALERERFGGHAEHRLRVHGRSQIDEPHAVRETLGDAAGGLDGETCLARPPDPVSVTRRAPSSRAATSATSR